MNRFIYILIGVGLYFSFMPFSFSQTLGNCTATSTSPTVIIAGDSWAQYMVDDNTHNKVLDMFGHGDKTALGNTVTYSVSGSEARQWADEANFPYLQNLQAEITANPTVEWVILSIGGNDILAAKSDGGWYKDMDLDVPGSEDALFNTVQADTEYIMNGIWAANPDMKIMISGYDYPNFNVGFLSCWVYACPKRDDLSRDPDNDLITDAEISTMMETVEGIRKIMADADDNGNNRIYYDNGMGLMHYYYGYDDGLYDEILPGATSEPLAVTPYTSGGDPNTPTDRDNFRLFADPIHLSAGGYEYKIKNQVGNLMLETLRKNSTDDLQTFFSEGSEDGHIDIATNTINSDGLRMGDKGAFCCSGSADNNYRSILSFDTSPLPDNAQITSASIYLIRSDADDNPFERTDKTPKLDIKNGHFGTNASLELADGNAPADASDVGCFHGTAEENKFALRIDLSQNGLSQINMTGKTQFRAYIEEEDWSNEFINFYDGGGTPAPLALEIQLAQYEPMYAFRTVKKILNSDSTYTEIEVERGEEVRPIEGYVLEEQLREVREEPNGDVTEFFVLATPLEHEGLAKFMADNGAPAMGRAPFLDVSYFIVLPVELVNFKAEKRGETAFLNWNTATEVNSAGFYIQHSTDEKNWKELGFVTSSGNSEIEKNYDFIHKNPTVGNNYYRLKMADNDGSKEYSEIRHLNFRNESPIVNIFPNPFNESLSFEADFEKASYAQIQVVDVLGKVVYVQQIDVQKGSQTYTLDGLSELAKGNYLLRIVGDGQVFLGKVVKQ